MNKKFKNVKSTTFLKLKSIDKNTGGFFFSHETLYYLEAEASIQNIMCGFTTPCSPLTSSCQVIRSAIIIFSPASIYLYYMIIEIFKHENQTNFLGKHQIRDAASGWWHNYRYYYLCVKSLIRIKIHPRLD